MKFILGKKVSMTQVFSADGTVVPVTRVSATPCVVVQVKRKGHDPVDAVQLGTSEVKSFRLSTPAKGHLKGLAPVGVLRDFPVEGNEKVQRGDMIAVDTFVPGDKISVIGTSKGKGFAGVVKRHHFRGGPKTHGHKDNLRAPGSLGAGGVQRVFKGMRMAGRMGGDRITVHNLEVVEVHPETNEILIKGALPGGRNAIVMIMAPGELKVQSSVATTPIVENSVEVAQPTPAEVAA